MEQAYLTISSKGQIVIPAAIRKQLGIEQGARAAVRMEGGRIILDFESLEAKLRRIREMRGCTAGGSSGTDLLLEERRQERAREQQEEGW